MRLDDSDYKSVYWAFNNLMEMKLDGSLPSNGDNKIIELYRLFEMKLLNLKININIKYQLNNI